MRAALVVLCALLCSPAAARQPDETFKDCPECPEMVVLPEGQLAVGRHEVTLGEYKAFADATGRGAGGGCKTIVPGGSWQGPTYPQTDEHPVACLSWDDAQEYLGWLSDQAGAVYRLPTVDEWVAAAEDSRPGCSKVRTGRLGTCPVGAHGASSAGLSDMLGNLWEWTASCETQGSRRRCWIRGGCFDHPTWTQRPGLRTWAWTDYRGWQLGFRVVRDIP